MSGDIATAALIKAKTGTEQATAKLHAAASGGSSLEVKAALAEQGEAARTEVMIKAAVAATTPNPAEAPLTASTVGNVLADVPSPDIRAAAVQMSRVYTVPGTTIRMAQDDASRFKQIEARGGDVQAEALRVIHGALGKDAPAALAAAKALVARDGKLRDFLAETGMGNSPWMVRHLAGVARKRGIAR